MVEKLEKAKKIVAEMYGSLDNLAIRCATEGSYIDTEAEVVENLECQGFSYKDAQKLFMVLVDISSMIVRSKQL